jgi:CHAD domain-containing protein
MLARRRAASRSPIREQRRKLLDADWPRRSERLIAAVGRRRRHRGFASFARRRFKPMITGFFITADRRLRSADKLHTLRIAVKRLRYALEIFAPAFPPRVRGDCQESLELLQKSLGEYTDHAALADRLAEWAERGEAGESRHLLLSLQRHERDLAAAARKSFSRWWNRRRRRSLRRTFERILRRHPV